MKLLLADDDRVLTHLLSTHLRARGWVVTVASDCMQAFMSAVRLSPDAILLDLNMPAGTGMDVLRKLKASMTTSQIPIVVLSGTTDPSDEATSIGLGAAAFLAKPADPDEVHRVLAEVTRSSTTPAGGSTTPAGGSTTPAGGDRRTGDRRRGGRRRPG